MRSTAAVLAYAAGVSAFSAPFAEPPRVIVSGQFSNLISGEVNVRHSSHWHFAAVWHSVFEKKDVSEKKLSVKWPE